MQFVKLRNDKIERMVISNCVKTRQAPNHPVGLKTHPKSLLAF